MFELLYKTKGNSLPGEKPRVYFTCHPEDFTLCFERVCKDIFETHDCAIYYTEDMSAQIPDEDMEPILGHMNLFVIPVTYKLLSTPNRAMVEDFAYARKSHIPILPIMMESGIDTLYSRPEKFGQLQYIDSNSTDATAIRYEEKLKKYLESVLVSGKTAERVRASFDSYIFLSYRKKDRRHANELMRIIHALPRCRDIAIWYDEFLTPGESFRVNIDRALKKSNLFALLVTPNLLEEPDGKPNFVMDQEYPAARKAGMEILPAQMVQTDTQALQKKFEGIPLCLDPRETAFRDRLLAVTEKLANPANDEDPEHNFLIGLAYLEGIDVETDRRRGLELITKAAESGCSEAMLKLFYMHFDGSGVPLNYQKAVFWAEKLAEKYTQTLGEDHPDTLESLCTLAAAYEKNGMYSESAALLESVYTTLRKTQGADHVNTLIALNNLAVAYGKTGRFTEEVQLLTPQIPFISEALGAEHPVTMTAISNLALAHGRLGQFSQEVELNEKVYPLMCRTLGEEHPATLTSLCNLALAYGRKGLYSKELQFMETAYTIRSRVLGKEHPDTLTSLNNLAIAYGHLGNHTKEIELLERASLLRRKVLGDTHPNALSSLNSLGLAHIHNGTPAKAIKFLEAVYILRRKVLGEEHPDTLTTLNNVALAYRQNQDSQKAATLFEAVSSMRKTILGKEHPDYLVSLSNLAGCYSDLGKHQKAFQLTQAVYTTQCRVLGEEHPDTITTLDSLALTYVFLNKPEKATDLLEQAYALHCKVLGEDHPDTIVTLDNLALTYELAGNDQKAAEFFGLAFAVHCKLQGEVHSQTLFWMCKLACALSKTARHQEAIALGKRLFQLQCEHFGEVSENAAIFAEALSMIYTRKGDPIHAALMLRKANSIRKKLPGGS